MKWTPQLILTRLRSRHRAGRSLAYRALAKADRALLSAAAYHFGSYRAAVEQTGIDYASVAGRPRWTKDRVIKLIKKARRAHRDLSWAAVSRRRHPLRLAAYAALRPRLFGSWARALQAAGVDADENRRYLSWDKTAVVHDLKQRHANGEAMNSGAIQSEDASLHAAAVRYYGSFARAMRAAKLNPKRG